MYRKFYRPPLVGIIAFVTVILAQPIGHSLFIVMRAFAGGSEVSDAFTSFSCGCVGFVLIWMGLKKEESSATWLGFIGAILVWTGWFEFTWEFFAHLFNVQPLYTAGGQVAMSPGLQIIQASGIIMFAFTLLYYLNCETRCSAFRWLHQHSRLGPGQASPAKKRDYARITAIETIVVIWFFYVVNLTLYDERILGSQHPVTYLVFFGFFIWAVYLNSRLIKYGRMAPAVRYAIPTTVITWLDIEVLSRWGMLDEFWLKPEEHALEMGLILAAFIVAGLGIYLTPERPQEEVNLQH